MTYHGTVHNGIIQIQGGLQLPEGATVRIELDNGAEQHIASSEGPKETVGQKLAALGRWAETQPTELPEDLATNLDHYLYGTPKDR